MLLAAPLSNTIPFGKYAGQDVRYVVDADLNYALWLLGQPFFRKKHFMLFSVARRRVARRLAEDIKDEDRAVALRAERIANPNKPFVVMPAAEFVRASIEDPLDANYVGDLV